MAMLRAFLPAALLAVLLALPAAADCYADYKASREPPLRLHYGVIALSPEACRNRNAAEAEAARRLSAAGWRLLQLMSTFGPEGLAARQADAGAHFLRY